MRRLCLFAVAEIWPPGSVAAGSKLTAAVTWCQKGGGGAIDAGGRLYQRNCVRQH